MGYENETCEGCRFYESKGEYVGGGVTLLRQCLNKDMQAERGWPDVGDHCESFTPSLECRKVRATETAVTFLAHIHAALSMSGACDLANIAGKGPADEDELMRFMDGVCGDTFERVQETLELLRKGEA